MIFLAQFIGWPESDTLTDRLALKCLCMLNRTIMRKCTIDNMQAFVIY